MINSLKREKAMAKFMNDIGRELRGNNDDSYRYFKLLSFDCPVAPEIIYNMSLLNEKWEIEANKKNEFIDQDFMGAISVAIREYRNSVHPTDAMKKTELERLAVFTGALIDSSPVEGMSKHEVYQKITTDRVKIILKRGGHETTILAGSSANNDPICGSSSADSW